MRTRSDGMTPAEQQVLDDIEANGVHIVHVPEDGDAPAHSFTVGLWHSFEQPEVIVFGLAPAVAQELLDAVADEASEGRTLLADSKHDGLMNYPVRFFAVPAATAARYFGVAVWAYEGAEFPCVQLVWPDKQGRWPWDAGVREGFAEAQPVLGRAS